MTFTVLAWWRTEPGNEGEVADLLAELTGPSRAEEGCVSYRVHQAPDDPTDFFLYEEYLDEAAYQAHQDSEHFQRIARDRAIPLLAERSRRFYRAIDGGAGGPS